MGDDGRLLQWQIQQGELRRIQNTKRQVEALESQHHTSQSLRERLIKLVQQSSAQLSASPHELPVPTDTISMSEHVVSAQAATDLIPEPLKTTEPHLSVLRLRTLSAPILCLFIGEHVCTSIDVHTHSI